MKHKTIGNITIPAIGQGSGGYGGKDEEIVRVLRRGITLGMNFIDTAEAYQNGHSEELVGQAILGMRDQVIIATKFSPEHADYRGVISAAENSLRHIGTDVIDLYQIHWPNSRVPMEDTFRALADLHRRGLVRHVGVSNFNMRDLKEAEQVSSLPIVSNQVEYNLVERGIEEELLPYHEKRNILTIAYSPLRRGEANKDVLTRIADMYGISLSGVILAWLVSHRTVMPIPMTTNIEHLVENIRAGEIELAREHIAEIEEAFRPEIIEILPSRIRVIPSPHERVYTTLAEATENKLKMTPGPADIAEEITSGRGILKPLQVVPTADAGGTYLYDLVQGRMRYWGWVIAKGFDAPIKVCVRK